MQRSTSGKSTASNQYMDYLRVESAKAVKTSTLSKSVITATHLSKHAPNHGYVDQHVTEDAFLLSVQLKDYHGDLWVDGRNVVFPMSRRGNFTFYDYNRIWQADMKSAFDCLNFHIPRAAITALEADIGTKRIETLNIAPGADIDDATVRGIAAALLPAVASPSCASSIFVDHICLALSLHLAVTYGGAMALRPVHSGGLAPWQLNRAMEMMDAHLNGELPVATIAQACGLSPAYFTRAFKQSTGFPPYRWMTRRRIEKAMDLMRNTVFSLSQVAYACGFSDQSHFTRVFSGATGMAPGQWKRQALR
ncbi:helix-turn-helix transcriptional regulator [Rhizobium daejeonense]|uniref:Helix-turn-helix transcriptional regulator n=1 Tax=Rhizobium daejeonense TaxID=240521 RepID=A0A6M1RW06_9HYPH|nr:AraC family transcriptional regulator [Rhizobium daejeonense]NGO65662.1 helix-turn-helix transcriptional regulator [Rhizobium daejeonense]